MTKKHLFALAALASLGLMQTAQADEFLDDRWYAAPFGTFVHTGGDRNDKDGWGGGMGFGKILDEHFNVEIRGFHEQFGGHFGKQSMTGGTADLQYYFMRSAFSPYAVIAAGGMNSCVSANCGASVIGEAGLGFTYELHDNLLFRTDARYRYANDLNSHVNPRDGDFHDMVVNAGFVIPFGDKPVAVAAAAPAPEPAPVADCSTLDADTDGVNDCNDQCAGTIAGTQVDPQGCPIRLELKGVNFRVNSAELTIPSRIILDKVAADLINFPQKNDIEVQGHTSSEASDAYNMKLSQKRSQAVARYLKMKGVTNRMYAKGYGERQPIASNSTAAGKAQNRRVELIWIGN